MAAKSIFIQYVSYSVDCQLNKKVWLSLSFLPAVYQLTQFDLHSHHGCM